MDPPERKQGICFADVFTAFYLPRKQCPCLGSMGFTLDFFEVWLLQDDLVLFYPSESLASLMPPHPYQAILFPILLSYIRHPIGLENRVQRWFVGRV